MGDSVPNGSAFPNGNTLHEPSSSMSGSDNPGFDGTLNEETLAPHKTIVSFVFDPSYTNSQNEHSGPSWAEVMRLFSSIYAIMLILLGLGFPLAEATGEEWLEEAYIGVFYAYLYLGGISFLIYCQFLLSRPHKRKKSQADNPYGKGYIIRSPPEENDLDTLQSGIQNNWTMTAPAKSTSTDDNSTLKMTNIFTINPSDTVNEDSIGKSKSYQVVPALERLRNDSIGNSSYTRSSTHVDKTKPFGSISSRKSRSGSDPARIVSNIDARGNDVHVIDLSGHQGNVNVQLHENRKSADLDVELIDMEDFKGMFSHEGSSFYLRMGALLFGIGNVIYVSLELEHHYSSECDPPSMSWIFFFQLFFILFQTFFIFKNPKIHLTRSIPIARLGFMHLVATNICVWIRTLISEIAEEFRHGPGSHDNSTEHLADSGDGCDGESALVSAASPYLFPFVLEYSLIAMATAAVMYDYLSSDDDKLVIQNIHHAIKTSSRRKSKPDGATSHHGSSLNSHEEQPMLAKSHRGVFLGMLIFTGLAISTVFFFFAQEEDYHTQAYFIFYSGDITVSFLLTTAALTAFMNFRKLSYKIGKPLSIDDLLILISMCGSFMFELSILVSAADTLVKNTYDDNARLIFAVTSSSMAAIETVIQVVFILAGMRVYSSKEKHQKEMPGRGAVAFMLLANVSVWLFRSIEIKQLQHGVQQEFFGFEAWTVILNIFLPLLLFYRFHSSVCLADIWQVAYKPMHH